MENLLDMTAGQRSLYIREQRERAAKEASYSRIDLRHTVETQIDRERREIAETEARRAEERRREKAEQRAHEIELARLANGGMNWGEVLQDIADALSGLLDRVQSLEERLDVLDNGDSNAKQNLKLVRKRRTTTPLPGRFPWSKKHEDWPGLVISEPRVTPR
jgi:hypothetical protein